MLRRQLPIRKRKKGEGQRRKGRDREAKFVVRIYKPLNLKVVHIEQKLTPFLFSLTRNNV
jgi:hypothetical protein